MKYYKTIIDGYIASISRGESGDIEISEQEYNDIKAMLTNKPTAESGYGYKLLTNLTWELFEFPIIPDEEAEAQDYESALNEMGVSV